MKEKRIEVVIFLLYIKETNMKAAVRAYFLNKQIDIDIDENRLRFYSLYHGFGRNDKNFIFGPDLREATPAEYNNLKTYMETYMNYELIILNNKV